MLSWTMTDMKSNDLVVERPPPKPRWEMMLAVSLELSMVAVFITHHAWIGLVFAAAYAWFSATWAALFSRESEEEL